jgi:rhamnosyltransferase
MNLFPPTKQNTFVVYVTYNPDTRLRKSINIVKNIFDNIVIIDNNSSVDINLLINNNIQLIKNNDNLGIAKALNIGAEYAIRKGALWLLMFDQDTIPRDDILLIYNSVYSNYPAKEKIGQIGISYCQSRSARKHYYNVTSLITSGSLLSLNVYKKIGEFRNDFFIDSVDFEYSLRVRKYGFVNLQSSEVAINHRIGNVKEKKCFFLTIKSTNHTPQRRYYMARNHVIISKKYFFSFPFWVLKKNFFFIMSLVQIILIEDQRQIKMKRILAGLKDGIYIN